MTQLTPILLLLSATATSATATSATAVAIATTVPVPWFREKYLTQIYNEYYVYSFSRHSFGDNDRDICPEIHKPSIYFAITGKPLWRETPLYRQVYRKQRRRHIITQPTPYDIRLIEISAQDVVHFIIDFYYYCFQQLMILLSVLLATLTTMILCILVFGQY